MDPDSIRTLLFMLILLALSGYFSATETAFSTYNRLKMKGLAEDGNKRAKLVLDLSEDYDRLLSTILVGNNIVNIALTTLATMFFADLILHSENLAATVSTIVTTVAVLIFGEISPKSLAKERADGFVLATAPVLRFVTWILTPINVIFSGWKWLLRLVFKTKGEDVVTEEEVLTMVDEAEEDGTLGEQESEMIRQVIAFNDREAIDILIPRVDVAAISADATSQELAEAFLETGFSRLPVYEESIDHVVGVVYHKDYYKRAAEKPTPTDLMKEPVFIHPTMKIRLLLKQLQAEQSHIAIVADEYGGTLGIVTMEDILEELVGEIWDEHDDVIRNIVPQPDGSAVVLCSTELIDLMEYFDTETECDATTVSGWVMEATGCIPAVGDTFTADGLSVEVTAVETTRPDQIHVWKVVEETEE
ncbi:MAG: HlyC/CorC family transporter [Clostridia bacterium]|nr:HlyC/CorC family transporter [Clostridia bacterium]